MKNTFYCLPAIFDNNICYPSIEQEIRHYIEQSIEDDLKRNFLGSDKIYYYYVEFVDLMPKWEQTENYMPKFENEKEKIVWHGEGLTSFIKFVQHRNKRNPFGPVLFATSSHCKSKIISEDHAFNEINRQNDKLRDDLKQHQINLDFFDKNYITRELDAAIEKANSLWIADVSLDNNLICAPQKLHWLWEKLRRNK